MNQSSSKSTPPPVRSVNWRRSLHVLLALLLALGLLAPATIPVAQADQDPPHADPALLQLAEEHPDDTFLVIIQREVKNKDLPEDSPEVAVEQESGKVRKQLPMIASFSAELTGKKIIKLAKRKKVRWISFDAPLFSTAAGDATVRDDFDTSSYSNNNGTALWASNWIETGDNNSPATGKINIQADTDCPLGGMCLEMETSSLHSIARGVNLANVTAATLSFNFKKASGGQAVLEVSKNNGASWTILQTYASSANTTAQFDLLPYASATTQIRFRVTSLGGDFWVDNLQISYNTANNTPTDTVADSFTSVAYSGSNGTLSWTSNPWTELGESDGAGAGKVRALANANCSSGNCLRMGGQNVPITNVGASRTANLSQAFNATLSFQYRRDVTKATSASVSVQASSDGVNWTTLATYGFATVGAASFSESLNITAYKSANTRIRFIGSGTAGSSTGYAYLYVDEVTITYTTLSTFARATRADQLRQALPSATGQGITVAVIDSGIANHGDLQGRILANNNQTSAPDANDTYGHGTFVAGIIAGNGTAAYGARAGIAPQANLINVKVSNGLGLGTISDLIDGLQWIKDNKAAYNIKVVNISLNSAVAESYHTSPLDAAVEILWFSGITVVVAAGNNGTGSGPVTLYPPANDPFVITVGAADDKSTPALSDDAMALFSAYGPTENSVAKPDLVAPGRNIISVLAGTSVYAYVNHVLSRVDSTYFRMSGTSMAAPMVSGAVALLLQDEPNLTPDQVKFRLKATANTTWPGYDAAKAGAGYLDAYAAVYGTTTQSANTGLAVSQLLTTGSGAVNSTVNWNSVNWNSVNWNSVNWNSVNWNSVNWNSVNWSSAVWDN